MPPLWRGVCPLSHSARQRFTDPRTRWRHGRGSPCSNARAESINRPYKAGRIHRREPWKTREAVEGATLEGVSGFNHHRLLEPLGHIPHAEAEEIDWRQPDGRAGDGMAQEAEGSPFRGLENGLRQKNLWASFGSGSLPST